MRPKYLVEHELDYVFLGYYDGIPKINTDEVEDWKYIPVQELQEDVERNPDNYSYWFRLILEQWLNEIPEKK